MVRLLALTQSPYTDIWDCNSAQVYHLPNRTEKTLEETVAITLFSPLNCDSVAGYNIQNYRRSGEGTPRGGFLVTHPSESCKGVASNSKQNKVPTEDSKPCFPAVQVSVVPDSWTVTYKPFYVVTSPDSKDDCL